MSLDYLIHLAKSETIDIHPGGERATYALLHALELRPQDCVLEIGCGTGGTLARLAQRYAVTAFGLEYLPEMLRVAKTRLQAAGKTEHAHLLQSSAVRLPFPDRSFDRVYCESVLGFQDVDGVLIILQEVQRVLKPAGLFVANEAIWKPQLEPQIVAEINRGCEADFGLRQATDQAWSIAQWLDAARSAGLRVRSAHLLADHLELEDDRLMPVDGQGSLVTWIFGQFYRLRILLDPHLTLQRLHYRRLLRSHREDGSYLEERLFILEKQ